eukprot:TRINITY_DN379_c0_g1_i6.p1 TRINITY_DN379_c0_g1~~TRINITY_DN379_c0_g1_i6.p1  ORF type:complete len:219 (+),score=46.37 TRINITY_DN379_c0_g1_i6:141-797(+)
MSLCGCFLIVVAMITISVAAENKDLKYGDLVEAKLNLTIEYNADGVVFMSGCSESAAAQNVEGCPQLSWDNNDFLIANFNKPETINGTPAPTQVVVMRCFSDVSIQKRAWRKHKDVISKDKQCKKVGTVDVLADAQTLSYKYVIPSDSPEATYYIRLLVKCGEDYCQDDNSQYTNGYYSIKPMESIPGGLVAGVVIAIIIAPTFLVLYFVYEFVILKK